MKLSAKNLLLFVLSTLVYVVQGNAQIKHNPKSIDDKTINIIFTSDPHFGINRKTFRGSFDVPASVVNAALVKEMNMLPGMLLPSDGGINSGMKLRQIDYLFQTGDISNRMEIPIQSAKKSWKQFEDTYVHELTLKNKLGKPVEQLLVPGNHDISNAIGFYKPMQPLTDPTSMVNMYNLMMHPIKPLSNANYNYDKDKIDYSRNIGGIHFVFITLWPDSAERIWMQKDLAVVPKTVPVIIFTHDPPIPDAAHFTNPTAPFLIIPKNKFENLVSEHYKDGTSVQDKHSPTDMEQRGFVTFLKDHPNIKAYFHGHNNWNEFYTYHGPDNDINLPVFRVDSPMKGKYSSKDETLLSFQLISIDPVKKLLTVRECFWNKSPLEKHQQVTFGSSVTLSLH